MKKLILAAALAAFALVAADTPDSVIHVINVKFKADAPKAAVDDAINSIAEMGAKYPAAGILRAWLKPIVVQGGADKFTHCLIMEFKDAAALKAYSGSEAQKFWYEKWLKVRELSNTHDVTNAFQTPKTVMHVINVKFKADAPKAKVDNAIASIRDMATQFPDAGILRVWIQPIQVQGGTSKFTHCLVMEFKDAAALKAYTGSAAQKWWYEQWLPVRELSNTHDVSN
jgi:uncharacterized protein (DUF1330 family)